MCCSHDITWKTDSVVNKLTILGLFALFFCLKTVALFFLLIFLPFTYSYNKIFWGTWKMCVWSQMLAVTALQLNNITLANYYSISYFNLYIIIISQYLEQKNAYRNRCFQLCAFHSLIHSYILVVNKLTCSKHFNWKSEANRKHFNLKQHYTFQFCKCWA